MATSLFTKVKSLITSSSQEENPKPIVNQENNKVSNALSEAILFSNDVVFTQANRYQDPSEIAVERESIPVFTTESKIKNDLFDLERDRRIDAVFDVVRPYYDYMLGYDVIAGRPDMCMFLQSLIKNFIAHFWDMPSSLHHHDHLPYGQLLHSLGVAVTTTVKVNNNFEVSYHGIDNERTLKEKPYALLAAFIVGLLHDADKIFCYCLSAKSYDTLIEYSPIKGGILNFTLAFPTKSLIKKYRPNPEPELSMVSFFFHRFIPIEVQQVFPTSVYWAMLKDLRSCHENTKAADGLVIEQSANSKENIREIHEFIASYLYFKFSEFPFPAEAPVFRLDDNWYAVHYYSFARAIADRMQISTDSITRILFNLGYFCGFKDNKDRLVCNVEIGMYLSKKDDKLMKCSFAVVPATVLDPLIRNVYRAKKESGAINYPSEDSLNEKPCIAQFPMMIGIQFKDTFNALFEGKKQVAQYIYYDPDFYKKKSANVEVEEHHVLAIETRSSEISKQDLAKVEVVPVTTSQELIPINRPEEGNDHAGSSTESITSPSLVITTDEQKANTESQIEQVESISDEPDEAEMTNLKDYFHLNGDPSIHLSTGLLKLFINLIIKQAIACNSLPEQSLVYVTESKKIFIRPLALIKMLFKEFQKDIPELQNIKLNNALCSEILLSWKTNKGCIRSFGPNNLLYAEQNITYNAFSLVGNKPHQYSMDGVEVSEFLLPSTYEDKLTRKKFVNAINDVLKANYPKRDF